MEQTEVILVLKDAIMTVLTVSLPILAGAMITGFLIAIFQATTQINEQTMAFVPKIVSVFVLLILLGSWMISKVTDFTTELYDSILTILF